MNTIDLTQIWPEWHVEGAPLGVGSFGRVYKAVRRDTGVESYAAIKVISILKDRDSSAVDPQELVNGCVGEIQLMESLKGFQNIVSVEDYKVVSREDDSGWDIYIRMELLTPLTSHVKGRLMSQQEVIKLGTDICTALEVCGKKGIIHRDIKPENIFVNAFGDFKLGDFGIARKLERGMGNMSIKGTINYMAPEVASSKDYDARVDTYSLGLVLYQYLNRNKLPFFSVKGQTVTAVEAESAPKKRLQGEKLPPPIDASQKMAEVILKACAYNPNARFQDASQMKEALQDVLEGRTAVKKRRVWPGIVAAVAAVALLGGAAVWYFADSLRQIFTGPTQDPQIAIEESIAAAQKQQQIASVLADAETLAQAEDLEGAIAAIQGGLTEYPDSEELLSKLTAYEEALKLQKMNAVLLSAKELADANDFLGAIALIQEAAVEQGELPEFVAACETYQSEHNRILKEDALAEANRLAADNAYLDAVQVIDEALVALGQDQDLLSRRTELEMYYVNQIIKQANDLLLVENFDGAESLVNEAIKQFPANTQLQSEAQRIQNTRPVYLLDVLTPYKKADHYNAGSIITMGGKSYLHGFTCMGYGEYDKGNQVFFNLDGKYSMISFDAGIVADRERSVTFLFHADGELIYKFSMKTGEMPQFHTFNIVNCKQLRISVYDNVSTIERSGTYGLANIMVKRNVSNLKEENTQLTANQVYLLNEMKPYKAPAHYADSSVLNMGGQSFNNGFSCIGYGEYNEGNKVYFNLDGKYSTMTFTAGLVLDRDRTVTFTFYTDGERALRFTMSPADLAVTHTINVEGCRQLLINVYDTQSSVSASGTYGIGEIIMEKSSSYNDKRDQTLGAGEHYLLDVAKPTSTPTRYDDSSVLSMGGQHYNHGFSCMGYGSGSTSGNKITFNLDEKYKQLSFTSGIIMDRDLSVRFRVYADGKKIYEYTMSAADLPVEHTVNIEGCKELEIYVYDYQWSADVSGTYGIADIVVTE